MGIPFFGLFDIYSVIEEACNYIWLKDTEYGFPLIEPNHVHPLKEEGAFFVNCRFETKHKTGVEIVIDRVCERLGIEKRYVLEERMEYGLKYLEFQWILM